jgi:hypothetical protein
MTQAQTAASQGYVLGATEGEHLVHWLNEIARKYATEYR